MQPDPGVRERRNGRAALAGLVKNGKRINFTTVARAAGVSTDFLYRHPGLCALVERHRAKGGGPGAAVPEPTASSPTSSAVRALTARLAQEKTAHQEEVEKLRKALEVAQGENLLLRRRLARFGTD
ncbi:hypothetical protein ACFVX9_27245 [Kitasatospora sp. NPDC058243]|uniref:hypothetical protein n=1 Tax=Kitasatospora sp. NPDC058243 TaxID=3346397 RepID=UPI0036D7ACB4